MDAIETIKHKILMIRYERKRKSLNISKALLDYILYRTDMQNMSDLLDIIKKSKNKEEFMNNIIDYLKQGDYNPLSMDLLIGCLTGNYNLFQNYQDHIVTYNH